MSVIENMVPVLEGNARVLGFVRDINIIFRPIRITDDQLIFDFFRTCSEDTIYYRFMSSALFNNIRKVNNQYVKDMVKNYVDIDLKNHMSIVATVFEGNKEKIVSEGRYITLGKDSAEVALVTTDDWQRQGIATEIAYMLKAIAISRGIKNVEGDILRTNQNMLKLLRNLKIKYTTVSYQDSFHFKINLKGNNKDEIR